MKHLSPKETFWVMFFMMVIVSTYAQDADLVSDSRPDFIISANLSGDASVISFGFEKLFFLTPGVTLAAKVGFGFNSEFTLFSSDPPRSFFVLPHHLTVNLGNGKRSFGEFGIGGSWITDTRDHYYLVYPVAGYRYHPFKNPGFSFRAWFYYPFGQISALDSTDIWIIPFGVSFGLAF